MIDNLMKEIVNMETEVPIFKLFLCKTDHTTGFSVYVDFRAHGQNIGHISTHGDTAIEALQKMRDGLEHRFMSREYYMKLANENAHCGVEK